MYQTEQKQGQYAANLVQFHDIHKTKCRMEYLNNRLNCRTTQKNYGKLYGEEIHWWKKMNTIQMACIWIISVKINILRCKLYFQMRLFGTFSSYLINMHLF